MPKLGTSQNVQVVIYVSRGLLVLLWRSVEEEPGERHHAGG